MKIQLPDGTKKVLDENLTLSEKKAVVEQMVDEWNPIILGNWDSLSVRRFLDTLADYLVWHKEEEMKNKQDKVVLSIERVKQMEGKRKSMSIPFSSLSAFKREFLGLEVQNGE